VAAADLDRPPLRCFLALGIGANSFLVHCVRLVRVVQILDDAAAVTLLQWIAKPHMLDHATLTLEFNRPAKETGTHV